MSLFEKMMNEELENSNNLTLDEELDNLFDEAISDAIKIPEMNPQEALKISAKTKEVEFTSDKLFKEGLDLDDDYFKFEEVDDASEEDPETLDEEYESLFDEDFVGGGILI